MGRKPRITDAAIIDAIRVDKTGNLTQCARKLGYCRRSSTPLVIRIRNLKERGLLTDEDTKKFKQLGRKQIDKIPDGVIIAAVHADQTGNLTQCARKSGFRGKNPAAALVDRIGNLKKRGLLTKADTAKFKQLGQKHIDRIPDKMIIAAIRADATDSLRQCGAKLGFQGENSGKGLVHRIKRLITEKKFTVEEAERRFPKADWRKKIVEDEKVRTGMELLLPPDEITFTVFTFTAFGTFALLGTVDMAETAVYPYKPYNLQDEVASTYFLTKRLLLGERVL